MTAVPRPKLAVLMYHGVASRPLVVPDWCFLDEQTFRKQMEFLAQRTRVVPLVRGASELAGDDDARCVALTFDDGLQCVYDVAFPILRDLELPATIFLATDFVGTSQRLWFCEVNRALAATRLESLVWQDQTHDLSSPRARAAANASIQAELKRYPQPILLERLRDLIDRLLAGAELPEADDAAFRVVDENAIEEMLGSGLVDLGAHTGSHAILSLLSEREAREEVRRSVRRASELAGRPCRLFAYPNGRRCDYTEQVVNEVRRLGIQVAVTTNEGANSRTQPLLELNRIGIGADMDYVSFERELRSFVLPG